MHATTKLKENCRSRQKSFTHKKEKEMNNDLLQLTPELVLFVKKLISHSRGGLTKDERQELAADLIQLLYKVLKELVDED